MRHRRLIATGAVLAAVLGTGGVARAQSEVGSIDGSVEPGVRSVTVSPGSVALNACLPVGAEPEYENFTLEHLQFPGGYCTTPGTGTNRETAPITITNGSAQSQIYVAASDATASGGGWTLCRGPGTPACPVPGQDQFTLLAQKLRCNANGSLETPMPPRECEPCVFDAGDCHRGPYLYTPPNGYIGSQASCDQVFDVDGFTTAGGQDPATPGCTASPGEASQEFLTLQGPSSTTSPGVHSFRVFWIAMP